MLSEFSDTLKRATTRKTISDIFLYPEISPIPAGTEGCWGSYLHGTYNFRYGNPKVVL
jgi:hypothetical protein